jgi:two-component system NtrC family sensor kinase
MKVKKYRARKSLRTVLMMWLMMFSIVPLAFITGYSIVKYEQAINQELFQRLIANHRELKVIINEFEADIVSRNKSHAQDKMMSYFLSAGQTDKAVDLAKSWIRSHFVSQISIFNRERRLLISLTRAADGTIIRNENLEGSVVLDEAFVENAIEQSQTLVAEFGKEQNLDLAVFSPIKTGNGNVAGYIDEVLRIDSQFLGNLKKRLNLEISFISKESNKLVSSNIDISNFRPQFFIDLYQSQKENLYELIVREEPFGTMIQPLKWGGSEILVFVAASKQASSQILRSVNIAFFTVVGTVIVLLVLLSFLISKSLLRPVNDLVHAVQMAELNSDKPMEVSVDNETELGILSESFNDMFERVHGAQKELKENIKKLELANTEIRDTQAKLVHSAKMASLGQLVAGVAHELNNPIGFIYSNMSHLRDYGDRLIQLIGTATRSPEKLSAEKERLEFDYIVTDMPKLIKSCEDGALRTKDIVLGLRNFSRLDEAKQKEVDIHDGIESTLALLNSEMKNTIIVKKSYSVLPKILCYPSQLNQVFMNILTNAIHAMPDGGEIKISTKKTDKDQIEISIQDSGVGMNEDVVGKIFDPFFTTKDVNQGTGLGMSIAYSVIQKHGGDIRVESKRGAGSTFIITLPLT